jgi:hypothetical protein
VVASGSLSRPVYVGCKLKRLTVKLMTDRSVEPGANPPFTNFINMHSLLKHYLNFIGYITSSTEILDRECLDFGWGGSKMD